MESYIQISKINDFLFCPRSLYLHTIYDNFHKQSYQERAQIAGTLAHRSIDKGVYSSRRRYLVGIEIFSEELGICGKIDVYDRDEMILIERKRRIKNIYTGQLYQLYGQMVCMREMGYEVDGLAIHSLSDNKRHKIDLPDEQQTAEFLNTIEKMKNLEAKDAPILKDIRKCQSCIYQPLCHPL